MLCWINNTLQNIFTFNMNNEIFYKILLVMQNTVLDLNNDESLLYPPTKIV